MLGSWVAALLSVAVSVDESVGRPFAGSTVRLLDDTLLAQRPTGGHEPVLPFLRRLGFVVSVEEQFPACETAILLGL